MQDFGHPLPSSNFESLLTEATIGWESFNGFEELKVA
jgi:hypothetical protein